MRHRRANNSHTLAAKTTRQLHVLGEDRDPLSVDTTEVSILKEAHKVSLSGLLQGRKGMGLKAKITGSSAFQTLGHLTHKPLKRSFADEKFRVLLILPNLTQSHRARAKAVRLLDPSLPTKVGRNSFA
jgi:hypothetical protein